jgi:hypothetical protein
VILLISLVSKLPALILYSFLLLLLLCFLLRQCLLHLTMLPFKRC